MNKLYEIFTLRNNFNKFASLFVILIAEFSDADC